MSDTTPPTSPSQTVGPYLHIGLPWPDGPFAADKGTPGGVWIRGALTDGAGQPVPDGLIETWQADPNGRFNHPDDPRGATSYPGFRGFGRCETNERGEYGIFTLRPGPVPGPLGTIQAPHINVSVFARGMLNRTVTRVYFPENSAANEADPVLSEIAEHRTRSTLLAEPAPDGYRFDIRLQGENETVFFSI